MELEELRLAVDKLRGGAADLKQQLEQRDTAIRVVQENLAIARTESELFQKKWAEAQLRAQTLGVNFDDADGTATQRQLIESVRALYLAQAEEQRLVEQLKRLLTAVESNRDVAVQVERTRSLLAALDDGKQGQSAETKPSTSTLLSAKVLDVNATLQLVVLDVGEWQGARIGMPFAVVRNGRVIAELRVIEVRRRICGALIERADKEAGLAPGDVARATKT
jgi:hypothetical protein